MRKYPPKEELCCGKTKGRYPQPCPSKWSIKIHAGQFCKIHYKEFKNKEEEELRSPVAVLSDDQFQDVVSKIKSMSVEQLTIIADRIKFRLLKEKAHDT